MDAVHLGAADDQPDDARMFKAITAQLTDLNTTPITDTDRDVDTDRDSSGDPIRRTSPAEQTTQAEPAPPAAIAETEPTSKTPLPVPAPTPDQGRAAAPSPSPPPPAAPPPVPVVQPAPVFQPRGLHKPDAPDYWGRHGLVAVYWIAILTGALGQVIFFGDLFNMGWPGYVAALVIATTAETVMVSSGDNALDLRTKNRRHAQWVPFLVIAFIAATAASGMNLTHWWQKNPSMAIIFGGIAFLGFVLHVVHGFGEGTQYRTEKAEYDRKVAELEAEQRAEFDKARREQERRQRQAEQATFQATAPAEPARPATATTTRTATPTKPQTASKTPAKKPAGTKVSRDEVLAWALRQDELPIPSEVLRHFEPTGRPLPTDRAVRNWLHEVKHS